MIHHRRPASTRHSAVMVSAFAGPMAWLAALALALGLLAFGLAPARAGTADAGWRIRLLDAAVVSGATVTLGEIAEPVGPISPQAWRELAATPLWPSPTEPGRPMSVNRPRLQQALREALRDTESLCLYPGTLVLQRGGAVLREGDLRALAVRTLTPALAAMPGEASMQDYRLPPYVFLAHPQQQVVVENTAAAPGRNTLRFAVREVDGSTVRKFTGSAFIDVWADVPCAAHPVNKDEVLTPDKVTHVRKNLAYLREPAWDGRGGPWRLARPVGAEQVIYQSDLSGVPTVRRGSVVMVLYESGSVRLQVQGEAMADGGLGETIPVRNMQSKRQIYAAVKDGGTVVVR